VIAKVRENVVSGPTRRDLVGIIVDVHRFLIRRACKFRVCFIPDPRLVQILFEVLADVADVLFDVVDHFDVGVEIGVTDGYDFSQKVGEMFAGKVQAADGSLEGSAFVDWGDCGVGEAAVDDEEAFEGSG
jgi:hypothetical protein